MRRNSIDKEKGDRSLSIMESILPFPTFSDENRMENTGQFKNVGAFFGEMSKCCKEDFDHRVPRLSVPSYITFKKPSPESETFLAELKIENTSNLPMTYSILGSSIVEQFEIKENPGWIPSHSEVLVQIESPKCRSEDDRHNYWGDIPSHEYFVVCATPIFREDHSQKEKLELYWAAFGSDLFPFFKAEQYMVIFRDEWYIPHFYLMKPLNLAMLGIESIIPPRTVFKNRDDFIALWAPGQDTDEFNFLTEFRLREVDRAMRQTESKVRATERLRDPRFFLIGLFLLILLVFMLIILMAVSNMGQVHATPTTDKN